ncbi:MAG: MarR family transcriptional regulator [Acidimicrobiia bacterium]|nr:MarR family transcriptional regulator [Acidimicrobiia bacterium]
MDSMLTTGEVAAALVTTRSRVHRAVAAGLVDPIRTKGGHLRFSETDLAVLRRHLGFVPRLPGLSREEVLVLTALTRRPFGLRSARAVARAAGISPTTATSSLRRLQQIGLVARQRRRVVLGKAMETDAWHAELGHRRWSRLGPSLANVVLPEPVGGENDAVGAVPVWLRHLFWNADVRLRVVQRDGAFIAGRVLASDDAQAHAWAATTLSPEAFRKAASVRGLEPCRVALAQNLAAVR